MHNLTKLPEFAIAVFSFLLHFVWEYLQVPTYEGMADKGHWEGIKICTAATFGDVGFALASFWLASAWARSRYWFHQPITGALLIFIGIGLALTIGFEYYYINVSLRWSYSNLMPLVPPFGTGLSPLLQWLMVPPLVVWFTQKHIPERQMH